MEIVLGQATALGTPAQSNEIQRLGSMFTIVIFVVG